VTPADRDSGEETPSGLKFQVLAESLRRRIADGEWEPGAKLPTEKDLSAASALSLTTVRRALDELAEQGLVRRRQGSGTFVSARAASLHNSTLTVGLLVPSTTQYYPRVISGIEAALSAGGARMVLSCYRYEAEEEDADIASLLAADVDGLLLVPTLTGIADPAGRARELNDLGVPSVFIERRVVDSGPRDSSEYVRTDHEAGAYEAIERLARLGHRHIGLVCRFPNPTGIWVARGYESSMAELGLEAQEPYLAEAGRWSQARADEAVAHLQHAGASAALVFGDREGAWLEGAARRAGLRIPQDLALVAYDDESADVAEIPLTAVSPPKYELGRLAAEILMRRLRANQPTPIHQISLRPRIVVRSSCGGTERKHR